MARLWFPLTTLIAALPAAFLAYLLVTTFLFHFSDLSPALMIVLGLTLLAVVVVVAAPVIAHLANRPRVRPAAAGVTRAAALDSDEMVVEADEFGSNLSGEAIMPVESAGDDFEAFEDSDAAEPALDDVFEVSEGDDFDAFEDFDEPPKKR